MLLKYLSKLSILAALANALSAALPVHAAGTIPLAMSIQLDTQGNVAANCKATFLQAGTVGTKQNIYADFGLTQVLGNPLSCDQSGRLPMFWIADGLIHVQLTDSAGVSIVDTTMQVLGPSSGGGGGSTVDPTTILATGDWKLRYGTGPLAGFVRGNGQTIGNASSGASERANSDTQSLWVYLCNTDPNLTVSGGRSGNCLNDFNAGKTITTPDMRGRVPAGLDDMGTTASGRLNSIYLGASATTLGAAGGWQNQYLSQNQLPNVSLTATASGASLTSPNTYFKSTVPPQVFNLAGGGGVGVIAIPNGATTGIDNVPITGTIPTSSMNGGVAQAGLSTVQPTMVLTFYIKL